MRVYRSLETYGEPLYVIRTFLRKLYEQADLDGMLLPVLQDPPTSTAVKTELVRTLAAFEAAAPLAPFMPENAASMLPRLAREYPEQRFGAVLRACELRALEEIAQRERFDRERFLIIALDCLGTFTNDDEMWWEDIAELTRRTIQFARQGGIAAYRFRSACQMCLSPVCDSADIGIGLIGLPVKQLVLVMARNQAIAQQLNLYSLTDQPAEPGLIAQREHIANMIEARRAKARGHIFARLTDELVNDVDMLITHLATCKRCQTSLAACPICTTGEPIFADDGTISRTAVVDWLASCAGCGMCEQNLPDHLPLTALFQKLKLDLTAFPSHLSRVNSLNSPSV